MERIKHIKETQNKELLDAQSDPREASPFRDDIEQSDKYDPATETRMEQIHVREMLNSFDEDTLKDIFAEYFRKSGGDEETMNWIPLDDVRIVYKTPEEIEESHSNYGTYSAGKGVKLNSNVLWYSLQNTLWTLIHEQCHAISRDRLRFYNSLNDKGERDGTQDVLRSGVSSTIWMKNRDGEETKKVFDNEINEGITELLTERIFREYKKRTGSEIYSRHPTLPDQTISNTDKVVAGAKFDSYERNWQNTKMYIGIISALADIPEDVVENAVIRTYIRNGEITLDQDPEIGLMLSEIYPKLGVVLYNMIKSRKVGDPSLRSYVDYLIGLDIPNGVRLKIITALNKISEEWGEAYKLAPHVI